METFRCSGILDTSLLTPFERRVCAFRRTQCSEAPRTLNNAIRRRTCESTLGIFLHHLNKAQLKDVEVQEDILDRLKFDIAKTLVNLKKLGRQNDICEDLFGLIQFLLQKNPAGKMTIRSVLQNMDILRLTGSKITEMDASLANLTQLQALILAGNCLADFPGGYLPKCLLLLELSCNRIHSLSQLMHDLPPCLLYLGLSRNCITQDELQPLQTAQYLYYLDLAHNNIEDLSVVIDASKNLYNLSSLMLLGNPCSMVASYMNFVTSKLKNLIFLDGEMLKTSEELDQLEHDLSGTLQIMAYRIMSFPQPANQKINKKKVMHTFRIEVYCPFLKSHVPKREENFVEDSTVKDVNGGGNSSLDRENKQGRKQSKKLSKLYNKGKGVSKLKANNNNDSSANTKKSSSIKSAPKRRDTLNSSEENAQYEQFLQGVQDSDSCFVSERKNWGKIIEFNNPIIEVPNCDLFSLRNAFRSNLIINVVHFKTLPPPPKKATGKVKVKKQDTINNTTEVENSEREANKEILVSKATIAKIKIPLKDIVWNERSLDYSWNIIKPLKVELTPGLRDIQYVVKKKKPPKGKKGVVEDQSAELQIPPNFTCHLGIGLKRSKFL